MSEEKTPTLHVIAGPNGAGKTTLYRNRLEKRYPEAEFVNADELAIREFGHPAQTKAESERGQELAEERRRQLMAERKSLVTESTFSHPSKVDLVRDAKAAGYEVVLYHVNVRSPNLSVMRVADRVSKGGHPVPEDKIRQRYDRNQPLIREAAKLADRAYIFDNSQLGKAHELSVILERGNAIRASENVPAWARVLYKEELQNFSQARQHRAAASFADAKAIAERALGQDSRTYIPRPDSEYKGKVIGETDLHLVQQISPKSAIAHFRDKIGRLPRIGDEVEIRYTKDGTANLRSSKEVAEAKAKADTFRSTPAKEGVAKYADLAPSYAYVRAVEARVAASQPSAAAGVAQKVRDELAGRIERGEPLPDIRRKEQDRDQDRGR
ncbi:zeta toxin family protein [Xanthomonas perforans]|uniref:zeta toxin family protein n=1 Tax=Xanthomonas perforans TaxID=442694 RepID=UPI0009BB81C8|nr:zeta toxin family protein [Xanthomonas perforans]MBZ2436235.1 zeta toxin family protein [Xanthomonas perforans]MBZ2461347.1 zeta toxin family protein [Xanthomonas perforans]MBZ2482773.1 zeta toxin family protein [Xanthomonas perforans]MBZ2491341.1 zeta toxin family protein [Xanthomonas perforans]MBZ2495770.1 zeta toxin family protein [Xanthomonas perforans]